MILRFSKEINSEQNYYDSVIVSIKVMMLFRYIKKPLLIVLAGGLLLTTAFNIIFPQITLAATGAWVNIATIQIGDDLYIDINPYDGDLNYKLDGVQGDCVSEVKDFDTSDVEDTNKVGNARLHTKTKDPRTGNCDETDDSLTLNATSNSRIELVWIDAGTLQHVVTNEVYIQQQGRNDFLPDSSDDCKETVVEVTGDTTAELIEQSDSELDSLDECVETSRRQVVIGDVDNRSIQAGQGAVGTGVNEGPDRSCEGTEFAFNFVLCPLLWAGDQALGWLDDKIISLLRVENAYYNDAKIQDAWANIRDLAFILLIPTMLIMVIGTALGFQFLDAYTVKRALPRMLAAIIFIALSFYICTFLIELVNLLGQGIAGIIAAPWGGLSNLTLRDIFDPGTGGTVATAGVILAYFLARGTAVGTSVGAGVASVIGSVTWITLGITVGLVALSLLIIFTLLAFREMAIIFLMLVSPLAILAWIFPGNDKPWKFWWTAFWKLLILFPLIMALITTGRVFALVVGDAGNADPVVGTIIKLVAVVGPYFFIPAAFKYAGGVFANIAGMVNDKSKGIFDRSRKKRAELSKHAREQASLGERYKGTGKFATAMNRRTLEHSARKRAITEGGFGFGMSKAGLDSGLTDIKLEKIKKANDDFALQAVIANDDFGAAGRLARGSEQAAYEYLAGLQKTDEQGNLIYDENGKTMQKYSEEDARDGARRSVAAARRVGQEVFDAQAVIAQAGSKTSFRGGPDEMLESIGEAVEGDMQLGAYVYNAARGKAEQAGRGDLANYSYGEGLAAMGQIIGASPDEKIQVMNDVKKRLLQKGYEGKSSAQIWGGHATSVRNNAQALKMQFDEADEQYEVALAAAQSDPTNVKLQNELKVATDRRNYKLAEINNAKQQVAYFSPENVAVFDETITEQEIVKTKGAVKLEEVLLDENGNRTDRLKRRKLVDQYVVDATGNPEVGPDGRPTMRTEKVVTYVNEPRTVQSEMEFARSEGSDSYVRKTNAMSQQQMEEMRRSGQMPGGDGGA